MDLDYQAYQPAIVYINGRFWGLLNLREKINEQIAAGGVTLENGDALKEPLEEGLVTASHDRIYAVKDSIPIMLVDESLPTAQLGGEVLSLLGSG